MGNYKFRLSDMIPNAWFYKLKDMNRFKYQLKTKQGSGGSCGGIKDSNSNKHAPSAAAASSSSPSSSFSSSSKSNNNPHMSVVDQRKSYHFTRDFNDFQPNNKPPKSSTRRITNPVLINRVPLPAHDSESDRALTPDTNTLDLMLCKCRVQNDIVIELLDDKNNNRLPPIITKKNPMKLQHRVNSKSKSPGLKLRTNTPRIGNRKINGGRKSLSSKSHSHSHSHSHSSFPVVKTSKDPRRDFRESMVEMIVENKISASKDLEELLATYLSLNSDEYHDLIINVFKQIWFDFFHVLPN